ASALPAARAVGPVGPVGRVDAVDLAGALVDHGRRAAATLPQLRFHHDDVTTWRPADEPYDLVQAAYGVFFLPDMDAGSRYLVSLLRPGGRFAVQTWRQGALVDFARCMFEAVADELSHPLESPVAKAAGERINSAAKLSDWLSSLELADVRVSEVGFVQPLTPELAWNLVLGTGWRQLLAGCDDEAMRRIRDGIIARLAQRHITQLDAGSVVGTAVRA
ncbi:MAG TPA: methyltransferase domain-containing protein, partial [Actinoallomurus sp.]|nr:methyltransferase domain-containing protein [Actinoallomurus sp.]